jgi:hypothetical protein
MKWALAAILGLLVAACERGGDGDIRVLRVRGLPVCAKGVGYLRPIVVRVDREPGVFEEKWSNSVIAEGTAATVTVPVIRRRMKAMLRVGLCAPTSLATWDCAAASWQSTTPLVLDARSDVMDVDLPPLQVPCADGSTAHRTPPR